MSSKIFERHIEYSALYAGRSVTHDLPASAGRATKTIEKRKVKYGAKAASPEAIEKAKGPKSEEASAE